MPMTERERPACGIDGFVREGISDGDVLCTGCWDSSSHDIRANHSISPGRPIYWRMASYEEDEWNAYCETCADGEHRPIEKESKDD